MNSPQELPGLNILGQRVSIYVILSILLLAAAGSLRFHDLSQRSMWIDEAVAAINSQGSIPQTIYNTRQRNTSPIVFPLILHAVQKVDKSARSVRLPSAIFSLLAVLVILAMPRAGADQRTALIAATVLTLSPSQIHWAQEAREYSLSVLLASLMMYSLLAFLSSEGRKRATLYATLFAAPLIQYGLVLFGFAVIGTLGLTGLLRRKQFFGDVIKSGFALGAGCVISLILTLRYQWRVHANTHLSDYFFNGSFSDLMSAAAFLAGNTYSLLSYLMLGDLLLGIFLVAFAVYACRVAGNFMNGQQNFIELTLFLLAIAIAVIAVLTRAYPYGAAHQCLYLAPVAAQTFGCASIAVADSLQNKKKMIWTGIVMLVILISATQSLREQNPYKEVEDIKSVISHLQGARNQISPIYVYPGARPALTFYGISGDRFVFGESYPQFDQDAYRSEINAAMERGTGRLWVIVSHTSPAEEDLIVSAMPQNWHLEMKVDATKAGLYLATQPLHQ